MSMMMYSSFDYRVLQFIHDKKKMKNNKGE